MIFAINLMLSENKKVQFCRILNVYICRNSYTFYLYDTHIKNHCKKEVANKTYFQVDFKSSKSLTKEMPKNQLY